MKYENHEYADIFPMMSHQEISDLADDMQLHGQMEPIVIFDGKILDGRNRYAACNMVDIQPKTKQFEGEDALAFVLGHNLHRRHLTPSQRAMIAEKVANMRSTDFRGNQWLSSKDNNQPDRKTREQAAKELGASGPSIDRARVVRRKGIPELAAKVESGEMSVKKAARIAALPAEEQKAAMTAGAGVKKKPVTFTQKPEAKKEVSEKEQNWIKAHRLALEASALMRNFEMSQRDDILDKVTEIINKIRSI